MIKITLKGAKWFEKHEKNKTPLDAMPFFPHLDVIHITCKCSWIIFLYRDIYSFFFINRYVENCSLKFLLIFNNSSFFHLLNAQDLAKCNLLSASSFISPKHAFFFFFFPPSSFSKNVCISKIIVQSVQLKHLLRPRKSVVIIRMLIIWFYYVNSIRLIGPRPYVDSKPLQTNIHA